jgi:hypothetical protein
MARNLHIITRREAMDADENEVSFQSYAVVACGTLSPEINHLRKTGFLAGARILYTKPGRHEDPEELEVQLVKRLETARENAEKMIVVYGAKFCYLNAKQPARTIDMIIDEQEKKLGVKITRIPATHCVDMLASSNEREEISEGGKVFWLTPGWIKYKNFVFQDWDRGKANETFPQNSGGAILLDSVGFWNDYSESRPEDLLEFSDWMGIPIIPHEASLDRFKKLLAGCL